MGLGRGFRDYKYWIQNRAEEIAREKYESEFEDLPQDKQTEVYNRATEAYKEVYRSYQR